MVRWGVSSLILADLLWAHFHQNRGRGFLESLRPARGQYPRPMRRGLDGLTPNKRKETNASRELSSCRFAGPPALAVGSGCLSIMYENGLELI